MKKNLFPKDFVFVVPISIALGAALTFLQPGIWWIGLLGFTALSLAGLTVLLAAWRWAGAEKILAWMLVLSLGLRLLAGVGTYLVLPVYGYDDSPDDRAGFVFTDAHRRDEQAWGLASSDAPIVQAFSKTYHTDQYGGLLAFIALTYRYLSPDAHRSLLIILLSVFVASLGLPFFWKAVNRIFGKKTALVSAWILALYPESVLLGGAAMREPYLITFSAMSLWGFVDWQDNHSQRAWVWLAAGLGGMLLVSPVVALVTLIILGGWLWMKREHRRISWIGVIAALAVFVAGMLMLAWALNRQGNFAGSPLSVIGDWFREVVKWIVYELERDSGRVQKIFEEMPEWIQIPFTATYGIFQPVLPAVFVEPTLPIWRSIGIIRALGWYLTLPLFVFAFVAFWNLPAQSNHRLWLWITAVTWVWITLSALRGGGDQWDNPRYRAILLVWQALVAGHAWTCYRTKASPWLGRILIGEVVFLLFFAQWYLSRYLHLGGRLPFEWMVFAILVCWALIWLGGMLWDRYKRDKSTA